MVESQSSPETHRESAAVVHQKSLSPLVAEAIQDFPSDRRNSDCSPGKHQVVWKVSGFTQDEAESLLHSLANHFGGDLAATDSTRVLRLPGFANCKLPKEFIVQARQETDAVYTLRDFTIHEDAPEPPRHLGHGEERPPTVPSGHKSQSEHDWAYAKRALARGDDPEEIIRRIADYRSDDKADPTYYARHTVTKAQAELMRQSAFERPADGDQAQAKEIGFNH